MLNHRIRLDHPGQARPVDDKLTNEALKIRNLFAIRYSLLVVNDVDQHFTTSPSQAALFSLRDLSAAVIACTSTPIREAPTDLSTIGRIIGHPQFMTPDATALECRQRRDLKLAQKDLNKATRLQIATRQGNLMTGKGDQTTDPTRALHELQLNQVSELKKMLGGSLIRRTMRSQQFDGTPCVSVPPCMVHPVWVKLTVVELQRLGTAVGEGCKR